MFIGGDDFAAIATGQIFGFLADRRANVGAASPVAVGGNLANATAVLTEVPVGRFAIAVGFACVDFHVVAGLSQRDF